jgi:hypothetical protein
MEKGDNMKDLSEEKIKVLVEQNGWSVMRAEGYLDGENCRRMGTTPSRYVQVGIDEYSAGFRASYYERQDVASTSGPAGLSRGTA